jgi:small subunit ribosomal protein S1
MTEKEENAIHESEITTTETTSNEVENSPKVSVPENFDWDVVGKKHDNYSKDERSKFEELYNNTLNAIAEHQVIDGTVVSKNNREVVVNIGYKSDGIIPLSEFRYNPDLKAGDTVEVYVESQEDLSGQLILSHKKARVLSSW